MEPLYHKKDCHACGSKRFRVLWGFYPVWLCSNEHCGYMTGFWSDVALKTLNLFDFLGFVSPMSHFAFKVYLKGDNYLKMIYKSIIYRHHE